MTPPVEDAASWMTRKAGADGIGDAMAAAPRLPRDDR
jgi:hypothetical protein